MKIFNTEFETSMRLLLLLSNYEKALDPEEIRIVDVLTVYGKQFNISETSLNGDCQYTLAEFTSGVELFEESLKQLSLQGLITVKMSSYGFKYIINEKGNQYIAEMTNDYSKEYKNELKKVKKYIASRTISQVKKEIMKKLMGRTN